MDETDNAELGSFVQSYNSKWLDGSLLLIPTTGFLPPDDPRFVIASKRAARSLSAGPETGNVTRATTSGSALYGNVAIATGMPGRHHDLGQFLPNHFAVFFQSFHPLERFGVYD